MTYELIENINKIECEKCNLLSNNLVNKNNKNYCPLCYEIIKTNQYKKLNEINNIFDLILHKKIIHQLTSNLDNNYKYTTILYISLSFIISTLLVYFINILI